MEQTRPDRRQRAGGPVVALLLATAPLLWACAAAPVVESRSPAPELAIDGSYEEWSGRFTRLESERSVALAVAHDAEHLYLCLVTRDLGVVGMLERGGFTLWLDAAGGRSKALGLRVAPHPLVLGEPSTPPVEILFDGAEYGYQVVEGSEEGPVDVRSAKHADTAVFEIRLALGRPLIERGASRSSRVTLAPGPTLGLGVEAVMPDWVPGLGGPGGAGPAATSRVPIPGGDLVDPLRVWVQAQLGGA